MGLTNISCQWLINIISSQMGFPVEINLSIEKSLKLSRFKSVISVQFSYSVMSDSLAQWTAACQPSLSFANSQTLLKLKFIKSVMPSNHLTLCHPFSSCLQSCSASGSFPMSQFFASGGQSIGVSALVSVLPMNIQG